MNVQLINISELTVNPNNPRIIKDEKFDKLVQSVKEFPDMLKLRPIVVDENNVILGGNMRFKACKAAKLKQVYVMQANELTDAQKREFIIKDNVSGGEWDWAMLQNDWDTEQLDAWGLDVPSFETEQALEAIEDDYEVPDEIQTDIVLGDLFEIGEHRLLCGDSTDSDAVAKLMDGQKADMVFTDPPYGIDWNTDYTRFTGGLIPSDKYNKIHDDEKAFDPSFLLATHENCLFFGANCFSDKLPKGNWIVWDKRFENGKAFLADAEVAWYNGSGAVYIIAETHQGFVSSDKKRFHPTQKPIKLLEKIFEKINAPNFLLDPYLGSGSTMVASHQLKRKCYGMELDPKYCQVIVDRMLKLDPTLMIKRNGQPYKTDEIQTHGIPA
jgi:DNA modification methylase